MGRNISHNSHHVPSSTKQTYQNFVFAINRSFCLYRLTFLLLFILLRIVANVLFIAWIHQNLRTVDFLQQIGCGALNNLNAFAAQLVPQIDQAFQSWRTDYHQFGQSVKFRLFLRTTKNSQFFFRSNRISSNYYVRSVLSITTVVDA